MSTVVIEKTAPSVHIDDLSNGVKPEGEVTETTEVTEVVEGDDPNAKVESEDDLPEWAKSQLKKVRDEAAERRVKLREAQSELDKAHEKAKDADELRAALEDYKTKMANIEDAQVRSDLAQKHNLPAGFGKRLVGTTEAELEADAKALAADLAPVRERPARAPKGGLNPSARPGASEDPAELVKQYNQKNRRRPF